MTPDQEKLLIKTAEAVDRIETGMLGNEYVKGAIPRLNALEARFNKHETQVTAKKNQNIGIRIALTTIWTGFILLLTEVLNYYRTK